MSAGARRRRRWGSLRIKRQVGVSLDSSKREESTTSRGAGHDGQLREWAMSTLDFIDPVAVPRSRRFCIALGFERLALIPFQAPLATVIIALTFAVLAVLGIHRIRIDDSLSQLFHSETPA